MDDVIGLTLTAETADGRRVRFRQPLIDATRRAAGTWFGDPVLVAEALLFLHGDPDEAPDSLHSVAVAMSYVAGVDGWVDSVTALLCAHHPREAGSADGWERWRDNGYST